MALESGRRQFLKLSDRIFHSRQENRGGDDEGFETGFAMGIGRYLSKTFFDTSPHGHLTPATSAGR